MPINSQIFTAPDGLPSIEGNLDNSLNGLPQDIRRIIPTPEAVFVEPLQYNDANTIILLHMDGTDASTTFTDVALGASHTWSANGNAQIDTANKQFGTGSTLFDGSGDYVQSNFNMSSIASGGSDWTIDFWVYIEEYNSYPSLFGEKQTNQNTIEGWCPAGTPAMYIQQGGTYQANFFGAENSVTLQTWHHLAFEHQGDVYRIYTDGVLGGTPIESEISITTAMSEKFAIGRFKNNGGSQFFLNGALDEFRVSNVARWGRNFTPQTIPYGTAPSE